MDVETAARKHALKNASDFGRAETKSVVGKVIAEVPEARKDMKAAMAVVMRVVAQVNDMKKEEIAKELGQHEFAEKKEEAKGITLPNAEQGRVVTRFPPEPNGYPHIGHAKAAFLDYEAAMTYGGEFILRFDDTNPEAEKAEYVDAIKDALSWLGIPRSQELYASDFMEKIYECSEKLISGGHLYACSCPQDAVKENRMQGKECACRSLTPEQNMETWKLMLNGSIKKGEASIRIKGDMASLNTAMRDPTMFRIIETEHYRQGTKYRVWPSYDFQAPVLDSLNGVTHAMRTKEYELRDEMYYRILDMLGMRKPILVEFSRLSIRGMPISKRLLKPLIEKNLVSGWDDPRLPTIAALRRRGILPEAIKRFVLSFGLGKIESNPSIDALLTENRKLLDPASERYFFVPSPIMLVVKGAPKTSARLRKHPTEDMGVRIVETADVFYISATDVEGININEIFRLKDLFNVKLVQKHNMLIGEYAGKEVGEGKKIQWVTDRHFKATVLRPASLLNDDDSYNEESLRTDEGYCEEACSKLAEGTVIQFERYGFCRLDAKNEMRFVFTNP